MSGHKLSRRRALQLGSLAATTAVAGCSLPAGGATGTPDSARYLSFEDGVDSALKERTENVYDRTVGLVDREIRDETTVRVISAAEMRETTGNWSMFGVTTTQQLAHRALGLIDEFDPDLPFEYAGAYSPGERILTLVEFPDRPIDDQLIAHELGHAIQFQASGITDVERGWETGFDHHHAQQGIVEGTAQFIEDEYVGGCDGEFSDCRLKEPIPAGTAGWDREWLLAFGAYVNGHEFAAALADRSGWDGVWDAHAAPPTHTGQVLKPEWYPDRQPEDVSVAAGSSDEWTELGRERLGMQSAFVTLWLEGALEPHAVYHDEEADADEVFSSLVRYRSPETDAWRGDEFVAFERREDEYGWVWKLRWESSTAAEGAYELFRTWADERGEPTDVEDVWSTGRGYETLALDGDELFVGSAPEAGEFESLSEALVE